MPLEHLALLLKLLCQVFFTLAVLSFLYRDNPLYKFAEHFFKGGSAVGKHIGQGVGPRSKLDIEIIGVVALSVSGVVGCKVSRPRSNCTFAIDS